MDTLQIALYGVGAIGLMPLTAVAIANALEMRRRRRTARMMERFADRMGL